jgi:hypothetical protein
MPFAVEIRALNVERRHFFIGDDDALGVGVGVEFPVNLQSCFDGRAGSGQQGIREAVGRSLADAVGR